MSVTSVETNNLQLSSTNGSKPLTINPFSFNSAKVQSSAAAKRAEMLRDERSWNAVSQVTRVNSTTIDIRAIVIDSYSYKFGSETTEKVNLLVTDATACYNGTEEIFQSKPGPNGESKPSDIAINKADGSILLPIGKAGTFAETLKEWAAKGVNLTDCGSHYKFGSPCNIDARLSLTSPNPEAAEIHSLVEVSVSVFAYLPPAKADPKEPNKPLRVPESVGMSFRVHKIKKIAKANSPHLFHLLASTPQMYRMPVPTFSEILRLDTDTRNAAKEGKQKQIVGSMLVTIPCLLGVESLEEEILKLDCGTVGKLAPVNQTSKSSFGHTTKDEKQMQIAELLITLVQWNGEEKARDVVSFRLWQDSLRVYGCSDTGPWGAGLGQALVTQIPAFFLGNVDHSDSEALMRAKQDGSIRSELSLKAKTPVVDVPGSIANRIGIPVSSYWASKMCIPQKRQGPNSDPTAHSLFTIAQPYTYKENLYNKNPNSAMFVLNEMDPNEREDFLKNRAQWNFFAVTSRILNDADFEFLDQLRVLQQDPKYVGPLGEMLTWPNWNCSKPADWKTTMYKDSKDPETVISDKHPVMVNRVATMAPNVFHYIYAVSPTRYNALFPKKVDIPTITDGSKKRERSNDNDDDDDDNNTDDSNENKRAKN